MMRSFQARPLIFLISIIIYGSVALATPFFWYCADDWGLYTNGSTYESNLKQLVASLASNAAKSGGFYNDTVGAGTLDQINGKIMCYADANQSDCLDCLKTAADEVTNVSTCRNMQTASIHYNDCFLYYSNVNFLSISDILSPTCLQNPDGKMPGKDFWSSSSVQSLIIRLRDEASNSDQKYATNKTDYMRGQTSQGLVQCTRDLNASECTKCIKMSIENANSLKPNCSDQQGTRIMGPNCYIRYELYSFDVAPYTVPSPPLPSALPPSISPVPPALPPSISPVLPAVPPSSVHGSKSSISTIIVAVSVTAGLVLLSATLILLWRRRVKRQSRTEDDCLSSSYLQENLDTNLELILNPSAEYQVFDLDTLRNATHNFSEKNKLGQGSFGPVYEGTLANGQQVAVKRLSGSSLQGLRELKNEVESLAKLKHKNLVHLVGCCIQKKENILCYEFLPNGSLDKILFAKDPTKRLELGWKIRYKIIEGIGRGLHYLHEESRVKIIHRDLKASNILLDKHMIPKISDFGLARFFAEDQTHIDTLMAGTFGYMAPECAHGNFSAKSDVYSFGVLLLETVTGQRNSSFANSGRASNLVIYAWNHWKNNTMDEVKDPMIEDLYLEEVTKCVHIALLCVQEEPSVRPYMEAVNHMLAGGAIPDLPSTWKAYMDISMSKESSMAMQSKFSERSSDSNTTRRSLAREEQ